MDSVFDCGLGKQVVMVQGHFGCALYDLFQGRIQRISGDLAEVIRAPAAVALTDDELASASDSISRLVTRGFMEAGPNARATPYSVDWIHPRMPRIRTISLQAGQSMADETVTGMKRLVIDAAAGFGLWSFALLVDDGCIDACLALSRSLLAKTDYALCEFWLQSGQHRGEIEAYAASSGCAGRIVVRGVEAAGAPEVQRSECGILSWGAPLGPEHMVCAPDYFHLQSILSESYGCLHVDSGGDIYPDVSEQQYRICSLADGVDTDALLDDERLLGYWSHGKDRRAKCSDCELRYACPNTLSMRSVAGDLSSGPGNCGYDLRTGRWVNA